MLDCPHTKIFLKPLNMTYDDPDLVCMAVREICALKEKNQTFSTYLASFRHILGDLYRDDEAIKYQLYQVLSEELKNALSLHISLDGRWRPLSSTVKIWTIGSATATRRGRLPRDKLCFRHSSPTDKTPDRTLQ